MNTDYRLQLRSHKSIFTDRNAALTYINRYFMPDNIIGEPTVYFYGEEDEPKAILAIGYGDRRYSIIDIGETNSNLDDVLTIQNEHTEKINHAVETIKGVINASGLTLDENKKENQVTFEPDPKDQLIGDSDNIAEAISILSKFVQDNFRSINLTVSNTSSVNLEYQPVLDGMSLSAAVNISTHGDSDDIVDNNNIIGIKEDGLYAAANLEYNDKTSELTFVTSGIRNGNFVDDANRKTISLGKHTQYAPYNTGNNVELTVDKENNTISANVKLSEDTNNIIQIQDDKLLVDGRANNIVYKNKTVSEALSTLEGDLSTYKSNTDIKLDELSQHIDSVEKSNIIEGTTTDTMILSATKRQDNGYKIQADVRLGQHKTIIHKDGGLEIDIEITCDTLSNKLIVRTGDIVKEIDLPVVDFIDNAYYDSGSQELVIEFNNGSVVRVSMGGLITLYKFTNNNNSPVVFQTNSDTEANTKDITTSFRLASTDNMLSINSNGELLSPLSIVTNAVEVEKNRAETNERLIGDALQAEIDRAKAAEQSNLLAINDNKANIAINTRNIETLMADENSNGSVRYIAKYVNDKLTTEINQEKERATASEQDLSNKITTLTDNTNSEIAKLKEKDTQLDSDISRKIENVVITKSDSNDLQYVLKVDGVPSGEINIPQDQFLQNVEFNPLTNEIEFTFKTDSGTSIVKVDISKLVDVYTAGDGLSLSENKFSVKKSTLSESYLVVSSEGIYVTGINAALSNKANTTDVYTKEEINNKNFLTQASLQDYARNTDVVAEQNRAQAAEKVNADDIDALELKTIALTNDIDLLKSEDKRLNLLVNESNTLRLNVNKQDGGTTLSGDVKVKIGDGNILKYDGNGLFSSVVLNYNKAENRISLSVNGVVTNEYELSSNSLVQEGHFDSNSKSIVLTILKDGEPQQIYIPVGDLVNTWNVDNGVNNPIKLSKTVGSDGVDVLKAVLDISTESHNAILNNNGTLYVSNLAQNLQALWGGDEITIQKAIENLKTETDKISGIVSDLSTVKSDVQQNKNNITLLSGEVDTLKTKVEQNTSNITQLQTKVDNISSQFETISTSFDELSSKVDTYDQRITKVENELDEIKQMIEDTQIDTINSRLEKIEQALATLIDFGTY